MDTILLAVDDTKTSLQICDKMAEIFCKCIPETIILLYVQKLLTGEHVMDDLVITQSEWKTLKESLQGTEHQKKSEEKAKKVMDHFLGHLHQKGITGIRPVVKEGHAAEQILEVAKNEKVDMIVMGCRSSRLHNLFIGSVSREVVDKAEVSVLLIK